MRYGIRMSLGSLAAITLLCAPLIAQAWSQSAMINVRVHNHVFHRVSIEADECTVQSQLFFTAPDDGYSGGSAERNYHRFKARVRLTNGKSVESTVFGNPKAGRRMYTFTYDTSAEGCWAKERHQLQKLDVEACRGRRCEPEPFK